MLPTKYTTGNINSNNSSKKYHTIIKTELVIIYTVSTGDISTMILFL